MSTLIIPIAGKSTRFDSPKWTLRDPKSGLLMPMASIQKIYKYFNRCVVIALEEHEHKYEEQFSEIEYSLRAFGFRPEVYFIKGSDSQPMTVYKGIEILQSFKKPIAGRFMVKDCDNVFELNNVEKLGGNFVVYGNIEDYPEMISANKSYIQFDSMGLIYNIVEKKVISSNFSVGGYGFSSAQEYIHAYLQMSTGKEKEFHLSHLIYAGMLYLNQEYKAIPCENFVDWGTQEDWNKYTERNKNNEA